MLQVCFRTLGWLVQVILYSGRDCCSTALCWVTNYLFFICVFAVSTEVGVSKVYSWEECGKSPTRVARQSLSGNPQQDSRFRHQNRVKEAWSKQRL